MMAENASAFKDMAAELAAILRVEGEKGRQAWSRLHEKLAEVASVAGDDPTMAVQAVLKVASDASSPQALGERISKVKPRLLKDLVLLVADELNMTPLGDSEPVHMVDKESNFCDENVDRIIKRSAELSIPNAPYAVVSIVGAQSSGKSYLLNRIFGTKFQEMDAKRGRSQTTRGIMTSTCIAPSLLLLDVEGYDGREKGKNTTFEKQAALFALTVSDLMMVNMLVTDVGREQGGATQLFRTIFQERAKLPPGLTKILVVLRRYDGETPIDILRSDVLESLEEIWESVNMGSVKFQDYIEVNIIGLSDKISPEFPNEVILLRKLLSNIRSAKVPASGFSLSSSMFWNTIKKNKELDISAHELAVARLFCRQLVQDILNSINSREEYKLLKAEGSARRLNEIYREMMEKIKAEYDLNTQRYDINARENERQYLVEKIHEIYKEISTELIWKIRATMLQQFKYDFCVKNIKKTKEVDAGLSKCVQEFTISCEDLKIFDSDHLSGLLGEIEKELRSYVALTIQRRHDRKKEKVEAVGVVAVAALAVGAKLCVGDFAGAAISAALLQP